LKKIASNSDETHKAVVALDKKLELHIQRTEFELNRINELDANQNKLLDEHIAGVNTLKNMYETHEKKDEERFSQVMAPAKWLLNTLKVVTITGGAAGALAAIFKLIKMFKGL
jgi:dynactin complex subunit